MRIDGSVSGDRWEGRAQARPPRARAARLLSPDPGRVMVEMAGFRNIIVHEDARIDADPVIRVLRARLEDFRRFEAEALGWL